MTKFALVRVEGMTREVLGAKGVSPGCTADTRDHTDYPLTVCDRFHGESPHFFSHKVEYSMNEMV